jgi:hypothetical protein
MVNEHPHLPSPPSPSPTSSSAHHLPFLAPSREVLPSRVESQARGTFLVGL